MADRYILHFPDGTEYGPIDRATLEEWYEEGRIPTDALVWPDGAPDWIPIEDILSEARSSADDTLRPPPASHEDATREAA